MCSKALQSGEAADFLVEAANAIRKINTAGIYWILINRHNLVPRLGYRNILQWK